MTKSIIFIAVFFSLPSALLANPPFADRENHVVSPAVFGNLFCTMINLTDHSVDVQVFGGGTYPGVNLGTAELGPGDTTAFGISSGGGLVQCNVTWIGMKDDLRLAACWRNPESLAEDYGCIDLN